MENEKKDVKVDLSEPDYKFEEMEDVDITNLIIKHEDDIRKMAGDVAMIAHFVKRVKGKAPSQFFKYVSDKEYVIVGVVIIAIAAIFLIPDPTTILSNIVTGLFGVATGRALNKDE